jgi:hypothetical protein
LVQTYLLAVLGLVHPLAQVRLMVLAKVVGAENHQVVEDYLEVVCFLKVAVNFLEAAEVALLCLTPCP